MAEDRPLSENEAPADSAAANPDGIDPELPVPRGLEVLAAMEAVLFSATSPLNKKRISVLLNGLPEEEVDEGLEKLQRRYQDPGSGLQLMEVGGGWQLATRPEVADWVLRLHRHRKRNPLTPSLLETLAIVAYKQPVTRAEVEAIRGVDCGSAARSLQDAGLIEVIGRKDVIGRPPLYGTTEEFLKIFGLKDLNELPRLSANERPSLAPPEESASAEESDDGP